MVKSLPNGFLIIFDGIDGVGKSSQIELAKQELEAEGWPMLCRRNLGGTPIGEQLRQVIKQHLPRPTETNLYISAAIQAALIDQINEDRLKNQLILMDRGPLSLAAYEIYGSGLDPNLGWPHVDEGMNNLRPDLTIIYEADVDLALKRARSQPEKEDFFENKSDEYFYKVAKGYKQLSKRYDNIICIDANRSIEAVHKSTMEAINKVLNN